ncbi:MAG: Rpn family recombination-promoting nuclease/putative transposase [Planctomycetaceae bacterium]|nr:Rpn family recombination-promoting nuclease/putative transposase [Planctomycetaceae bacterium]
MLFLFFGRHNEPILRSLLSGVMTDIGQPPVLKATVQNPFNIQEYPSDKEVRLDVWVEDASKAFYNVEIQREEHTNFCERMLYYWGGKYGSQLQRGQPYTMLRPVRSIIIAEFPIFPLLERLHAVFELRSRENPDVKFSEHCQMHVLRLGDLIRHNFSGLDQFGLDMRRWMQFWAFGEKLEESEMSTMLQDCPPVHAAYEEFKRFSSDPAMQEKVKARQRFLDEQQLLLGGAYEEGRAIEKIETAQNFKRLGVPIATIAEATGLSLPEIEQLR